MPDLCVAGNLGKTRLGGCASPERQRSMGVSETAFRDYRYCDMILHFPMVADELLQARFESFPLILQGTSKLSVSMVLIENPLQI